MKKIAIVCEYKVFPERLGGMDRFFVAFDAALKHNGYKPTWFFKDFVYYDFYKDLTIKNAQNTSIENFFLQQATNTSFDIVVTHFLQVVSSFYKKIKNNNPNVKIINIDHNPRPLNGFPLKKRLKNKIKGILYGKYVDQLIGVSNYTSDHIIKDFGHHLKPKTKTIYNGIDVSSCIKQTLDRNLQPFNFVVVSHLRESKGIQDLIKALTLLSESTLNKISLTIYGEGNYKEYLTKLVTTNNLEKKVFFKGSVANVNQLLHKYNYLIQPTYMECFSLSLLESLACNVPVITTNVGGNTELISNGINGFIFTPKNSQQLATLITNVVENKKTITGNVNNIVEVKFTLENMVKNHLKAVTSCTSPS